MWNILKILGELLLPPNGLVLLALLGTLLALRWRKTGVAISVGATVLMLILAMPAVSWWMTRDQPAATPVPKPWPEADAVVVLGGGRRGYALEYDTPETAGPGTLERVRYAARVARQTGKPLLVSGGKPLGGARSEAEIMQEILRDEYGLPVRWVEAESVDTASNARLAAPLLLRDGIRRIYLVSHADHLPRASAEFRLHGLTVVPLGTGFLPTAVLTSDYFIPSFAGTAGSRWHLYNRISPWFTR